MAFNLELYRNFPVYARLLDADTARVLEHVCNAFQPELNALRNRIVDRGYFYNLNTTPEAYLDWLQQFVGGSPIGEQFLGLGLNPNWSQAHKRKVISRLWRYWQMKGTEWGVREAIALWLQWEPAHGDRLEIRKPFGKSASQILPQWWQQYTPYDATLNQTWTERQFFGSGDYGQSYRPDYFTLQGAAFSEYGQPWSDRFLTTIEAPRLDSPGSMLGPERPRLHFFLAEDEWNNIFPDILTLNPEIWSVNARPCVFGWLNCRLREALSLEPTQNPVHYRTDEILTIDGFRYGDSWHASAGVSHVRTETTEVTEPFEVAPGHGYFDAWSSQWTPCPSDAFYYVPAFLLQQTRQEVIEEVTACRLGALATVVVGRQDRIVGRLDPTPPNQLLRRIPAFDYRMALDLPALNLQGQADVSPPTAEAPQLPLDLAPLRLSLTPMNLSDLRQNPGLALGVPALTVPMIPLRAPDRYQWEPEIVLHQFGDFWNRGYVYYGLGQLGDPGSLESVPITTTVPLCNVIPYSTGTILSLQVQKTLLPATEVGLLELYPILGQVSNGEHWRLLVESTTELYWLKPSTMFWSSQLGPGQASDRAQEPDLETGRINLYLEFLLDPKESTYLKSYALMLQNQHLEGHRFILPLAAPRGAFYGFRCVVPLRFASGALTLEEEAAISAYLPRMQQNLLELSKLISPMTQPPPLPDLPEETLRELLRKTGSQLQSLVVQLQSTQGDFVIKRSLLEGSSELDSETGLTKTVFTVSTGLGHDSFAVGEIRSLLPPYREVDRPTIETVPGTDTAVLTFWSTEVIPDDTLQVWFYAQNQPR